LLRLLLNKHSENWKKKLKNQDHHVLLWTSAGWHRIWYQGTMMLFIASKCTYAHTLACLERRRGSERARSWCKLREPCTSLISDAIKPHLALPMLGLPCTHFLWHQYPSIPHTLFPTYPRTVRGPRVSAVLLFYTDQMNRVHSSEEAPCSFTMAPCVVVERLEGQQRCSRAPVDEHAELQAREWPRWLFTEKRKVNEEQPNPAKPHQTPGSLSLVVLRTTCAFGGSPDNSLTRLDKCHLPLVPKHKCRFSRLPIWNHAQLRQRWPTPKYRIYSIIPPGGF